MKLLRSCNASCDGASAEVLEGKSSSFMKRGRGSDGLRYMPAPRDCTCQYQERFGFAFKIAQGCTSPQRHANCWRALTPATHRPPLQRTHATQPAPCMLSLKRQVTQLGVSSNNTSQNLVETNEIFGFCEFSSFVDNRRAVKSNMCVACCSEQMLSAASDCYRQQAIAIGSKQVIELQGQCPK